MCFPAVLGALGLGGAAAGATAAGAAGAAATAGIGATLGSVLQIAGLVAGVVGLSQQSKLDASYTNTQIEALDTQAQTEAQLTAVADQRKRQEYQRAIATQRAELAARGVDLDSPTAIMLGQTAAQEMSFDSQAIRSDGIAKQKEIAAEKQMVAAQGQASLVRNRYSAVSQVLNSAPDIWPGLADVKILK